jgi:fructose-bisphosphate aldolase class I
MNENLESVAATLVADGKGILAADESGATITGRFDAVGIRSTEQSRRASRVRSAESPAPRREWHDD